MNEPDSPQPARQDSTGTDAASRELRANHIHHPSLGGPLAPAAATGATGGRRVAAELARLDDAWTVLHDRLLRPGQAGAHLDHVVVGPGGVFLVDSQVRAGTIRAWEGDLFQHVRRGGYRQTISLAGELAKARGMAAYMTVESDRNVTAVLCLAGAQEASFGEPRMLRDVWVVPVSQLAQWLSSQPTVLSDPGRSRVLTRVMTDFPSSGTDPELLPAGGATTVVVPPEHGGVATAMVSAPAPVPPVAAGRADRESVPNRDPSLGRALGGIVSAVFALALGLAYVPSLLGSIVIPVGAVPLAQQAAALDCRAVTGAQIASVLGRPVEPVATETGCAWGSRLENPPTVLVRVRTYAVGEGDDAGFRTSRERHGVAYGTAPGPTSSAATALRVAGGEPMSVPGGEPTRVGAAPATARGDIEVVLSDTILGIPDAEARVMALAIARAVNAPRGEVPEDSSAVRPLPSGTS